MQLAHTGPLHRPRPNRCGSRTGSLAGPAWALHSIVGWRVVASKEKNISDPDDLNKQEPSNLSGQKLANSKQPSTSSKHSYDVPPSLLQHSLVDFTSRLGETLYNETYVSPSQILPIPKAAARKNIQKTGKKRVSSRVLTSTPIKDEIVADKANYTTKIKKTKKQKVPVL